MKTEDLRQIKSESERVQKLYEIYNEDTRLNYAPSARVEFLTNTRYIEQYLKPGNRILEIGAGAGEYCLHFANQGYDVSAVELAPNNIKAFRQKIKPHMQIDLRQGNALDLSFYADNSFDIVMLFGPLYHLEQEADRQKAIAEAKRVCKPDGTLFFSYISNDMVILTELCYTPDFFLKETYNHETFQLVNFPFVFFTLEECRQMLHTAGVSILHEVASDGVSELLQDKLNALDSKSFQQYLRYHFYCCEKPEMLGRSNHLLFVGKQ